MKHRIVITGVGLTSPLGNDIVTLRENLLAGKKNIGKITPRYMEEYPAGICDFPVNKYQTRKDARRGTRAGQISVFTTNEAINNSGIELNKINTDRVGVFIGTTEHGNVETENEVANIKEFGYDVKYWSHHHNPRSIANNPAGEACLNLQITGPHCCIGAACAAGNYGIIYGAQQLLLGEVDVALAGGVSESIHTFGIFASFLAQNALAKNIDPNKASRPLDKDRNGIVISEGGCIYVLERLEDAIKRNANIIAELASWCVNTDATDFVMPNPDRQAQAINTALKKARLNNEDVDIISLHATATPEGDVKEIEAVRKVFNDKNNYVNAAKGFLGHTMGAAGALELAGNLPSFIDSMVHPCANLENIDEKCLIPNIIQKNAEKSKKGISTILNNSFGMLGINSVLVVKKFVK